MAGVIDSYVSVDIPGGSEDAPAFYLFQGTGGDEHQFTDLAAELKPGARRIGVRGDVAEGDRFGTRSEKGRKQGREEEEG